MYETLAAFRRVWSLESEKTAQVLGALTDASLQQRVGPGHRTLAELSWHIVKTIPEMMERLGLRISGIQPGASRPHHAAEILAAYQRVSASLVEELADWTDPTLQQTDNMYGMVWKRGETLSSLVLHQAHHRGQMTVLMRQAGIKPPGVYGPAQEDWEKMGMQPPPE